MKSHAIPVKEEGIYLFKAPARITAQINHELLIVFVDPAAHACGAVFFPTEAAPRELPMLLDALFNKMKVDLKTDVSLLRLKLFGLSEPIHTLRQATMTWAQTHKLEVSVEDIGKGVVRNLIIDCETGRVGVSYAEGYVHQPIGLLSAGSANARTGAVRATGQVLVLAQSRVSRQLCKQAIEEQDVWHALVPEQPFDWIVRTPDNLFPAKCVLMFEDMGKGKPVEKWVTTFRKLLPHVPIFWVGKSAPRWIRNAKIMSGFKPQALAKFKIELHKKLSALEPSGPATSEVIPFPKASKSKLKSKK